MFFLFIGKEVDGDTGGGGGGSLWFCADADNRTRNGGENIFSILYNDFSPVVPPIKTHCHTHANLQNRSNFYIYH